MYLYLEKLNNMEKNYIKEEYIYISNAITVTLYQADLFIQFEIYYYKVLSGLLCKVEHTQEYTCNMYKMNSNNLLSAALKYEELLNIIISLNDIKLLYSNILTTWLPIINKYYTFINKTIKKNFTNFMNIIIKSKEKDKGIYQYLNNMYYILFHEKMFYYINSVVSENLYRYFSIAKIYKNNIQMLYIDNKYEETELLISYINRMLLYMDIIDEQKVYIIIHNSKNLFLSKCILILENNTKNTNLYAYKSKNIENEFIFRLLMKTVYIDILKYFENIYAYSIYKNIPKTNLYINNYSIKYLNVIKLNSINYNLEFQILNTSKEIDKFHFFKKILDSMRLYINISGICYTLIYHKLKFIIYNNISKYFYNNFSICINRWIDAEKNILDAISMFSFIIISTLIKQLKQYKGIDFQTDSITAYHQLEDKISSELSIEFKLELYNTELFKEKEADSKEFTTFEELIPGNKYKLKAIARLEIQDGFSLDEEKELEVITKPISFEHNIVTVEPNDGDYTFSIKWKYPNNFLNKDVDLHTIRLFDKEVEDVESENIKKVENIVWDYTESTDCPKPKKVIGKEETNEPIGSESYKVNNSNRNKYILDPFKIVGNGSYRWVQVIMSISYNKDNIKYKEEE